MNFVIFPLLTQLHPAVIHFPMALLYIEFFFLCLYLAKKKDEYDNFSHWLLLLCSLSFVPVLLTGLHDSGADLGPGVQFINGFFDRVENFFTIREHNFNSCDLLSDCGLHYSSATILANEIWQGNLWRNAVRPFFSVNYLRSGDDFRYWLPGRQHFS